MVKATESVALPAAADPARLETLWKTGLLDSAPEEAFDRIARLAERLLDVPVVLVSLVDKDRQFFKSVIGLAEPWASRCETPMEYSFCRYSVTTGAPLIVDDARRNALVADSPAIEEIGVVAYAGYPVVAVDGHVMGNLCVIDSEPRTWRDWELELLGELTAMVATEVRYRLKQRGLEEVESAVLQLEQPVASLGDAVRSVVSGAGSRGVMERQHDVLLERSGRVESVIDDLVQSVRTGATELGDTADRVDLCAHLRRIADLSTRTGDAARLVLDHPDNAVFVVADPDMLARALSHLLVTGLLHAPPSDVVTVRIQPDGDRVRFHATLPGGALASSELARLVTRFGHALGPGDQGEATLRTEGRTIRAEDPPVAAETGPSGTVLRFETPAA